MNTFSILCLLLSILLINAQFQPRTSPRRTFIRPMTRNSGIVGARRGPMAPAPARGRQPHKVIHAPGFKPPTGIAKKLNEATDFRALARVLLKL